MTTPVEIVINGKDNTGGAFSSVGSALGGLAKAAGAVALAGGAALVGFLSSSVKEAIESENAMAQLNAVLESTKGVAGVSAGQVSDLADSLSNMTRFTDEAIVGGESMLLTFTNIGSEVFPAATSMALDMSQALGQDVTQSAMQLGKALNDPIAGVTALRRVGVQLTDEQEKQVKAFMAVNDIASAQKVILGELATEFGGSAVAAGKTFAGQMDILKNKFSNIQEGIGMKLMPSLLKLGDMFSRVLSDPRVLDFIERFGNGIAEAADGLFSFFSKSENFDLSNLTGQFKDFMRGVDWQKLSDDFVAGMNSIDWVAVGAEVRTSAANIWKGIKAAAEGIDWQAVTAALGRGIGGAIAGLSGYISWDAFALDVSNKLAGLFGYAGEGAIFALAADFQAGFNFIKQIFATSVLGWKAIIQGFTNVFLTTLTGLLRIATNIFSAIALAVASKLSGIKGAIQSVLNAVGAVFGSAAKDWMSKMVDGIMSGISNVISAIMKMVNSINSSFSKIKLPDLFGGNSGGGGSSAANLGGASAGGGTSNHPSNNNVQAQALGGNVYAGNAYTVGEVGMETFVPETNGVIIPHGATTGGGNTNNNYYNAHITVYTGKTDQRRSVRGLT